MSSVENVKDFEDVKSAQKVATPPLRVFSIRDVKAGIYNPPFFQNNNALASRAFGDLATDPQAMISKHPEDYQLFFIGEFFPDSGVLVATAPVFLPNASDFVLNK